MTPRRCVASGVIALLLFAATVIIAILPTHSRAIMSHGALDDPALVTRGGYLARAGDCTACHTAPEGASFAGGTPLASPIGLIYPTNITPDRETGIGAYSLDDFDRALRRGIRRDGATLYPAMPYPSYAHLSDADVAALYAYFEHGVAAVRQPDHAPGIVWPLSMRWPVGLWRKAFAPDPDHLPARHYADASVARGAYLVQGLGHCGSCHTPRQLTMQEVALDESQPGYLAGGALIDGWNPLDLRGDQGKGMGLWSAADIVASLATARNGHAAIVGAPMLDVVRHSTQYLTAQDRQAIADYLKTLPAADPSHVSFAPDGTTAARLAQGGDAGAGSPQYLDSCAGCHRSDGTGYARVFPAIAGNPTVLADDPGGLIRLILGGSQLVSVQAAPSALAMPGFGWRYGDQDAADLATFLRAGWGNHAAAVSPAMVAKVRTQMLRDASPAARQILETRHD